MSRPLYPPVEVVECPKCIPLSPSFLGAIMSNFIKNFVKDEDGATMVEYGLMVALIAVVLIAVVTLVGKSLSTMFNNVNTAIGGT
jgi:pilus assembly protein Flp/PilA